MNIKFLSKKFFRFFFRNQRCRLSENEFCLLKTYRIQTDFKPSPPPQNERFVGGGSTFFGKVPLAFRNISKIFLVLLMGYPRSYKKFWTPRTLSGYTRPFFRPKIPKKTQIWASFWWVIYLSGFLWVWVLERHLTYKKVSILLKKFIIKSHIYLEPIYKAI